MTSSFSLCQHDVLREPVTQIHYFSENQSGAEISEQVFSALPSTGDNTMLDLLRNSGVAGLTFKNFFSPAENQQILETIYRLKPEWQKGAGPGDFTVGNVWYAYIAFEQAEEYWQRSAESRAYMETNFPGLEERILSFCKYFLQDNDVIIRPDHSGPAFVIFAPDSETAVENGQLHIDFDGLPEQMLNMPYADNEAFSFILPLQLPPVGGDLYTWPDIYDPMNRDKYMCGSFTDMDAPDGVSLKLPHCTGKLMGIKSLRVHQIESFNGSLDRITLNFRLTRIWGQWVVWF